MVTLLRRVRGLLGTGLTWATMWAALGALAGIVVAIVAPEQLGAGETPLRMAWILGVAGFVSGSAFAVMLSQLERGHSVRDVSLVRVAIWGALGAAVIPLFSQVADSMVILTCPLGAVLASGSVAIARHGEPRALAAPATPALP